MDDIHTLFGTAGDTQLCFCGENSTALPAEPLDPHNLGCLIWDWALATRKITAKTRTEQLTRHAEQLGIDPGN
jgi:hypothetical protein